MSIQVSIPDEIADELYWQLDELDARMSQTTRTWFTHSYRPKMQLVWKRLEGKRNAEKVEVAAQT